MIGWPRGVVGLAAAVVVAMSVAPASGRHERRQSGAQTHRPTFRLDTHAVLIDTTVERSGKWVDDLTAEDFLLTDRGVRQQVVLLSHDRIPLDLTCYIDISGSVQKRSARFWQDVRAGVTRLRADDRLRLVTIGRTVREIAPLHPAPFEVPSEDPPTSTLGTVVHDAVIQALMQPATAGRRNVVLIVTDGDDRHGSVSTIETMRTVAARTEALMILAMVDVSLSPYDRDAVNANRSALRDVIRQSGGTVVDAKDLPGAFADMFQALDRTYVLAYVPEGVAAAGWHDVRVTVTRPGAYEVRSKPGYFGSDDRR